MFSKLYVMDSEIQTSSSDPDVYVCGAKKGADVALMIAYYNETEGEEKQVEISIKNWENTDKSLCVYILDKDRDMQKIQIYSGLIQSEKIQITMPAYSVCLIESK